MLLVSLTCLLLVQNVLASHHQGPQRMLALSVAAETLVNTYTSDSQSKPAVATLTDGKVVITWESASQDGSGFPGVYAQMFNADGSVKGTEFRVPTIIANTQTNPAIGVLKDGGFVIAWQSNAATQENNYGIYAQRYDGNGVPIAVEFRANTYTTNDQTNPSVAGLVDGGFIITWQSPWQPVGRSIDIYGQRYNADGTPKGGEVLINNFTDDAQQMPAVIGLANGGFIVTWMSYNQGSSNYVDDIYFQRFDATGTRVGKETRANTYLPDSQGYPSIAELTDGKFVIMWESQKQDVDSTGPTTGIYGQMFNADGSPFGIEFQANTYKTNNQELPSVTALPDGSFLVVWQSYLQDTSRNGVYAQLFTIDGVPSGSEFRANTIISSSQELPAVATINNGYIITWQDSFSDKNGNGVMARWFTCPTTARFLYNNTCFVCPVETPLSYNGTCYAICPGFAPYPYNNSCYSSCPPQVPILYKSQCYAACPTNAPLTDGSSCYTACPTTAPFLLNQKCYANCPAPTSYSFNNACYSSCPTNAPNLYQAKKQCYNTCPTEAPYVQGQKCVTSCSGQTSYSYNQVCLASCPPEAPNLYNGVCYSTCPNTVPYTYNRTCYTTCPTGFPYAYNQNCFASCPPQASNSYNRICYATCPSVAPNAYNQQCYINCPNTAPYAYNQTCNATCPTSAPNVYNQQCYATCPSEAPYLYNKKCYVTCPSTASNMYNKQCYAVCPSVAPKSCSNVCSTPCPSKEPIVDVISSQNTVTTVLTQILSIFSSSNPMLILVTGSGAMIFVTKYIIVTIPAQVQTMLASQGSGLVSAGFGISVPASLKNLSRRLLDETTVDEVDWTQSGLYNLWDPLLSFLIILAVTFVLILAEFTTRKYQTANSVFKMLLRIARWNLPLLVLCGNFSNIMFYSFTEFRSFSSGSPRSIVSLVICLVLFILSILILIKTLVIVRNLKQSKLNPTLKKKNWQDYSVLYTEFKDQSYWTLAFLPIYFFRLLLVNIVVTNAFASPMFQTIFFTTLSVLMMIYMVWKRPLKSKLLLGYLLINETLVLALNVCLLILASLDAKGVTSMDQRDRVGDVIVILNEIFSVLNLVLIAIVIIRGILFVYDKVKRARKQGITSFGKTVKFIFSSESDTETQQLRKGSASTVLNIDRQTAKIDAIDSSRLNLVNNLDQSSAALPRNESSVCEDNSICKPTDEGRTYLNKLKGTKGFVKPVRAELVNILPNHITEQNGGEVMKNRSPVAITASPEETATAADIKILSLDEPSAPRKGTDQDSKSTNSRESNEVKIADFSPKKATMDKK